MPKQIHKRPKHVLSVLRKLVGASLNESKLVLGLAPDTVKSIQCGRLNFSERAALIVSQKTGVSVQWLLSQDGSKPPKTDSGMPYTKQTFDRHEANRDKDDREPANINFRRYSTLKQFRSLTTKLAALLSVAHKQQKVGFVNAKLDNEMRRLAKLLREAENARAFENIVGKQINCTKPMNNAENEAGLIAVFNQLKAALPEVPMKHGAFR